jgi:hypothetical protein
MHHEERRGTNEASTSGKVRSPRSSVPQCMRSAGLLLMETFLAATCARAADTAAYSRLPTSWAGIAAYSTNQVEQRAAGLGPMRHPDMEALYTRYKAWIRTQQLDNHGYVATYTRWEPLALDGVARPCALEPNIVPYHVEPGVEHWVLWHHPDVTAGETELEPAEELRVLHGLLRADGVASLRPDEVIVFQNVPSMRSIPTIAHSHVFLRPRASDEEGARLRAAMDARRAAWSARSPWLSGGYS